MSLAQRMPFLQDVFQMTAIAHVSEIVIILIGGICFETPSTYIAQSAGAVGYTGCFSARGKTPTPTSVLIWH